MYVSCSDSNAAERCKPGPSNKTLFSMSAKQFDRLNWFARQTGLRLIFDLNVLIRNPYDNTWNYSNAIQLLSYASTMNYSMDFELGNEPNSFRHKFNQTVPPQILAKDYKTLQEIISIFDIYRRSKIIGPSITQPDKKSKIRYLRQFLKGNGMKYVSAITFHQYYLNGRIATEQGRGGRR